MTLLPSFVLMMRVAILDPCTAPRLRFSTTKRLNPCVYRLQEAGEDLEVKRLTIHKKTDLCDILGDSKSVVKVLGSLLGRPEFSGPTLRLFGRLVFIRCVSELSPESTLFPEEHKELKKLIPRWLILPLVDDCRLERSPDFW
jgi:hypothetical protein